MSKPKPDYNEYSSEDLVDLGAKLNLKMKEMEETLEAIKRILKTRYKESEIPALLQTTEFECETRESDDFYPIDPYKALELMRSRGLEKEFPGICTVNINNSGKNAKVKTIGLTHYIPEIEVQNIRLKKPEKMITLYLRRRK